MKNPLLPLIALGILSSFIPATALAQEDGKAADAAAEKPKIARVADFTKDKTGIFTYESWLNKTESLDGGILINSTSGADGKGGMGRNFGRSFDMSEYEYLDVALAVGAENTVPGYRVGLTDEDGTQIKATYNVSQLRPNQPVWLRVPKSQLKVDPYSKGKDGKFDWEKVSGWVIQGDWTTDSPAHILFVAVEAR